MQQRRIAVLGMTAAMVLLLTGCEVGDFVQGQVDKFREDFRESKEFAAGGSIEVENSNGGVTISTWNQNRVEITGTKYAISPETLKQVKIDITQTGSMLRIRTVAPQGVRGYGARYELKVPATVNLDRIKTSNGGVEIEGVKGSARINTSNGGVTVRNHTGDVDVDTSNGKIELTRVVGRMRLDTSNGGIHLEAVEGELNADTSNGRIEGDIANPKPGSTIRLDTSNGGIDLTLDKYADNPIVASTSNGGVKLRLPADINARLIASTSNGSIDNDFEQYGAMQKKSKTRQEMTIGRGGPLVDISTSNSSIDVVRR